jgi:hypothetical protein
MLVEKRMKKGSSNPESDGMAARARDRVLSRAAFPLNTKTVLWA